MWTSSISSSYYLLFFFYRPLTVSLWSCVCSLFSVSGLTGVLGTIFQQKLTFSITPWSHHTRGRFSLAWRALAAWPHFPRVTAPHHPLRRASSNQCSSLISQFALDLKLIIKVWRWLWYKPKCNIQHHKMTYTPSFTCCFVNISI